MKTSFKLRNLASTGLIFISLSVAITERNALAALSPNGAPPAYLLDPNNNYSACAGQTCANFNGRLKLKTQIVFNPSSDSKDKSRSLYFQNGNFSHARPTNGKEYIEVKADFSKNKLNVSEMFMPDAQNAFDKLNPQIIPYDASGKIKADSTLSDAQGHFGKYLSIHQNYNVNTCNGSECFVQEIDSAEAYPKPTH